MAITFSDDEIAALVHERKPLPDNWRTRTRLRPKPGHREAQLVVEGDAGNEFHVILRQNSNNLLDFSVILAARVDQSNRIFRLRRYNGKSHEHRNLIENEVFYDFHIHEATARYQELGTREDAYAKPTDRYGDHNEALRCLIADASFIVPPREQLSMF